MPTGYTSGVADGTVTDFREYALICARAFGACILLRDEPLSAEIPEFEPSDYHTKKVEEATARLGWLRSLNDRQKKSHADEAFAKSLRYWRDCQEETATKKARYETMLAKAKAFVPPTEDHRNYAAFLVSQLEESMRFDCHEYDKPSPVSPDEWHASEVARTERDISYHTRENEEETARTKSRNEWVSALRTALDRPAATT